MIREPVVIACDAVLIDMDGTLVDSTAVVERHWGAWAARHAINLAELLRVSHGRPTIETLRLVAPTWRRLKKRPSSTPMKQATRTACARWRRQELVASSRRIGGLWSRLRAARSRRGASRPLPCPSPTCS